MSYTLEELKKALVLERRITEDTPVIGQRNSDNGKNIFILCQKTSNGARHEVMISIKRIEELLAFVPDTIEQMEARAGDAIQRDLSDILDEFELTGYEVLESQPNKDGSLYIKALAKVETIVDVWVYPRKP